MRPLGIGAVVHGRDRENLARSRALVREELHAARVLFLIVTVDFFDYDYDDEHEQEHDGVLTKHTKIARAGI